MNESGLLSPVTYRHRKKGTEDGVSRETDEQKHKSTVDNTV